MAKKLWDKIEVKHLILVSITIAFSQLIMSFMGLKQTAYGENMITTIGSLSTGTLLTIASFATILVLLGIALFKKRKIK